MSLMRDMMGYASVPALFGKAYMENYPDILHDVYDMDAGLYYFLIGFPRWTPWPAVTRAHLARARVWESLNAYHRALDASTDGKPVELSWGDLDDVSELIKKRNIISKGTAFHLLSRSNVCLVMQCAYRSINP